MNLSFYMSRSCLSYLPVFKEIQCYLYILKFMESHASFFSRLKEKKNKTTNMRRKDCSFTQVEAILMQ